MAVGVGQAGRWEWGHHVHEIRRVLRAIAADKGCASEVVRVCLLAESAAGRAATCCWAWPAAPGRHGDFGLGCCIGVVTCLFSAIGCLGLPRTGTARRTEDYARLVEDV